VFTVVNFNGWLTPSTLKAVVIAIFLLGAAGAGIKADITALEKDKAEKIDVAKQQATITQILISIDDKLGDLKASVKDLDTRQRAILKAE